MDVQAAERRRVDAVAVFVRTDVGQVVALLEETLLSFGELGLFALETLDEDAEVLLGDGGSRACDRQQRCQFGTASSLSESHDSPA